MSAAKQKTPIKFLLQNICMIFIATDLRYALTPQRTKSVSFWQTNFSSRKATGRISIFESGVSTELGSEGTTENSPALKCRAIVGKSLRDSTF
jgi:hypothetical protein